MYPFTENELKQIGDLAVQIRALGKQSGLRNGHITFALGLSAKALAMEALAGSPEMPEQDGLRLAKEMLTNGFEQNMQMQPAWPGSGASIEPKKGH